MQPPPRPERTRLLEQQHSSHSSAWSSRRRPLSFSRTHHLDALLRTDLRTDAATLTVIVVDVRCPILVDINRCLRTVEPAGPASTTAVVVDHRVESSPAPCLASGADYRSRIRCLWHISQSFWLSIDLVDHMKHFQLRSLQRGNSSGRILRIVL